MLLIAHNIRSLHNVGSIFRSADAFRVQRLYLTGYSGTPPRREIAKVALGSEQCVAWEHRDDAMALIAELRAKGSRVFALDNIPGSMDIRRAGIGADDTLVLGNEVGGLEAEVRDACDGTVEIILPGRKRSLNVSVACAVALFAVTAPHE